MMRVAPRFARARGIYDWSLHAEKDAMAKHDDLIDLVDNPDETLAVEYKSGLDLSDPRSKANFARHVAALANHGGGYLVFGFNNDLTRAAQTEFLAVDRDAVAGIVKSYLNPPFQCEVRVVTARSGARHTIVVVPSHGSVPVCAQRDGPQDARGVRKGSRAEPITSGSLGRRANRSSPLRSGRLSCAGAS